MLLLIMITMMMMIILLAAVKRCHKLLLPTCCMLRLLSFSRSDCSVVKYDALIYVSHSQLLLSSNLVGLRQLVLF